MFGLPVGQEQRLVDAAKMGTNAGATFFELAHGLTEIPASVIAESLKEGGMNEAAICVFFGSEMGNPLGRGGELETACSHFDKAIMMLRDLRSQGITCNTITGPSCLPLGLETGLSREEITHRIRMFFKEFRTDILMSKSNISIGLLRNEENRTFKDIKHWMKVIDLLNDDFHLEDRKVFSAHVDVHHIASRGWDTAKTILALGKRTGYLDFHGMRRVPIGSTNDQKMPWANILTALNEALPNETLKMCYSPFGEEVRDECPDLDIGLPESARELAEMIQSFEDLQKIGFNFVA